MGKVNLPEILDTDISSISQKNTTFYAHNSLIHTGWRKKKLTCLIKHNAETTEFITRKTCSSLLLMSNLKFDMPYMLFHAIFAEISKFQSQYAFLKSAQIS